MPLAVINSAYVDSLIVRLSHPLADADRDAFARAAQDAVTHVPCWGEGALYRAVAPSSGPTAFRPATEMWVGTSSRNCATPSSRTNRRSNMAAISATSAIASMHAEARHVLVLRSNRAIP